MIKISHFKQQNKLISRLLAWVLLSILLMLHIPAINIVHAEDIQSDFALEETATVLVEGGNFNTLKAGELIFADRTYTFADTVPEYLIGQEYLFQKPQPFSGQYFSQHEEVFPTQDKVQFHFPFQALSVHSTEH